MKNMNKLYIILKYVIWRFPIYSFFRENMDTLNNAAKSIVPHIFAKFKYVARQTIYSESPDHVL